MKYKINSKKSAVPEYIWYISLIIIAITLVVGIVNITKKANKNIEPPSNLNVQFDVTIDPNNVVRIKELNFIGQWDLEKDAPNLYLCCGNSCKNMMELFLAEKAQDLFARKVTGSVGLKEMNGLVLGKNGKAMLFDGKTGYIEVPNNPLLNPSKEITVMVVSKAILPTRAYYNIISNYNAYLLSYYGKWTTYNGITSSWIINPEDARFTFIVYTPSGWSYNGYKGFNVTRMNFLIGKYKDYVVYGYLNGIKVITKNWGGNINDGGKLEIGRREASSDNYYHGIIDEVRIYNRALSDEEIKQCYLGNCPNDDSLVLYLDF
ncbi:MAG: LamG domain-containing protein, partial [Nanoarchaeota archaeon]